MRINQKDDSLIMAAIEKANNGHHMQAARLLHDAGNQCRSPKEKDALWKAAEMHRAIANSD